MGEFGRRITSRRVEFWAGKRKMATGSRRHKIGAAEIAGARTLFAGA